MLRMFQQAYHIPGTLAANATIVFAVPCDCHIVHASAVATNDSDATLKIGDTSDDDEYCFAFTIGDSSDPTEKDHLVEDDFRTTAISKGTAVKLTLDYDGTAGTAAQNVTIVLTLTEG